MIHKDCIPNSFLTIAIVRSTRREREFYRSFINQYYLDFAHQVLLQEQYDPYLTKTLIAPHDIQLGATPRRVTWKDGMPIFQITRRGVAPN